MEERERDQVEERREEEARCRNTAGTLTCVPHPALCLRVPSVLSKVGGAYPLPSTAVFFEIHGDTREGPRL